MTAKSYLAATLVAGIAAAAIEMIFVLPIQASLGNSPGIVFQSIASGTMGKAAYIGGTPAILLGIFYHVLISLVAAGAYIAAATRL
uniref:hypothetical protein n=1 Tax=Sphingomonas asaccharolytica TaxID=40681 RepID=UPI000B339D8E